MTVMMPSIIPEPDFMLCMIASEHFFVVPSGSASIMSFTFSVMFCIWSGFGQLSTSDGWTCLST